MIRNTSLEGAITMEFYSKGERDKAQLWIQQGKARTYSQEAGWGAVDGKLLRRSIRG